jgi:hypothetical protein
MLAPLIVVELIVCLTVVLSGWLLDRAKLWFPRSGVFKSEGQRGGRARSVGQRPASGHRADDPARVPFRNPSLRDGIGSRNSDLAAGKDQP